MVSFVKYYNFLNTNSIDQFLHSYLGNPIDEHRLSFVTAYSITKKSIYLYIQFWLNNFQYICRSKINVQKNNFDFLFFEDIRDGKCRNFTLFFFNFINLIWFYICIDLGDIKRVEKYLIFATQDDKDNGLVIAALAGTHKIMNHISNCSNLANLS